MSVPRCGALSAEYGVDGEPITYVCLLPAGHDGREPAEDVAAAMMQRAEG